MGENQNIQTDSFEEQKYNTDEIIKKTKEVLDLFNRTIYLEKYKNIRNENPETVKNCFTILDEIIRLLGGMEYLDENTHLVATGLLLHVNIEIGKWDSLKDISLFSIINDLYSLQTLLEKALEINKFKEYEVSAKNIIKDLNNRKEDLERKIEENNILSNDLKNKKVNEIFEDDSKKFKSLARIYEMSFYLVILFLFLYFFGCYIDIKTEYFKFQFAEQFYGNYSPTFYIQKISLLILSTTLAAFLLKRSFMNRRLADEAYRTAKELDALPRYMEGMPDEMKEKIRFDLAYKYFGQGIHHESYTSGENLMHENIKANTEFLKAIKGSGSDEESKKDGEK